MSTAANDPAVLGFAEDYAMTNERVREARDEAILAGLQPISTGVASALTALAATSGATAVVEIGTLMGASALALLAGMNEGILTSIDAEAERQIAARRLLGAEGYATSRFRLIAGNPLDVVAKLRNAAYDVVFINGDKLEYVEYIDAAGRLLRPGGLLLVHDALWHGEVADPDSEGDEAIIIREALEAITSSESYHQAMLPLGNGLLLAAKK